MLLLLSLFLLIKKLLTVSNDFRSVCYKIRKTETRIRLGISKITNFNFKYLEMIIEQSEGSIGMESLAKHTSKSYLELINGPCENFLIVGNNTANNDSRTHITIFFNVIGFPTLDTIQIVLENNHHNGLIELIGNDEMISMKIGITSSPLLSRISDKYDFSTSLPNLEKGKSYCATGWQYGIGTITIFKLPSRLTNMDMFAQIIVQMSEKRNNEYILIDTVVIPVQIDVCDENSSPSVIDILYAAENFVILNVAMIINGDTTSLPSYIYPPEIIRDLFMPFPEEFERKSIRYSRSTYSSIKSHDTPKSIKLMKVTKSRTSCMINNLKGFFDEYLFGTEIMKSTSKYFEYTNELKGVLVSRKMDNTAKENCRKFQISALDLPK